MVDDNYMKNRKMCKTKRPVFVTPSVIAKSSGTRIDEEKEKQEMLDILRFHKNKNLKKSDEVGSNIVNEDWNKESIDIGSLGPLSFTDDGVLKTALVYVTVEVPKVKAKYTCSLCKREFKYLQHRDNHELKAMCKADKLICDQCGQVFKQPRHLVRHIQKIHSRPRYQCAECLMIFPSEHAIENHLKHHHKPRNCKFCNKTFKNSNTVRSHALVCKLNPKAKIPKLASSEQKCESSVKVQKVKIYSCSKCDAVFKTRGGLHKHAKTHRTTDATNQIMQLVVNEDPSVVIEVVD